MNKSPLKKYLLNERLVKELHFCKFWKNKRIEQYGVYVISEYIRYYPFQKFKEKVEVDFEKILFL